MACKNICTQYKVTKGRRTSYYVRGYKRRSVCKIFLDWQGSTCPCCGLMLRVRPRHQISEIGIRTKCQSALNGYEQRDVTLALKKL